ncbi:MAG TPA: Mur ligase family protein [Thermoanaerobaculaceae bacterium]|nr:Mur ligase family protein [Thermoanaerobaculaceae bacterium]
MEVTRSRSLVGPSLWLDGSGAVADVCLAEGDPDPVPAWRAALKRANAALGWPRRAHSRRSGDLFIALAIEAPPDCLAAATRLNDWAITGGPEVEFPALLEQVVATRRPDQAAAIAEAERRELPWLLDEVGLTLGLGSGAVTVLAASEGEPVPAGRVMASLDEVAWDDLRGVPVVVVTGTTGTTATARLLARIATMAGHTVGLVCQDGIVVGDEGINSGDRTGPEATRTVLRDPRLTFAVLEVPVPEILAHGLLMSRIDVAVVTGVTVDPDGDHGVSTRQHLVEATLVAARAARHVVLNADDTLLAEQQADTWFSPDHPVEGASNLDGQLAAGSEPPREPLMALETGDVTRPERVSASAAAAAARAAGLPITAIASVLDLSPRRALAGGRSW